MGWSNNNGTPNRSGWGQPSGQGYNNGTRNDNYRANYGGSNGGGNGGGYGAPRGQHQGGNGNGYNDRPAQTYQRAQLTYKRGPNGEPQATGTQYAVITLDRDYRAGDQVRVKASLCSSPGKNQDDGDVWLDVSPERQSQRQQRGRY